VDNNLLLLIVTGLANVLALIWIARLERELQETTAAIRRTAVHQREMAQMLETHNQLADFQNLTESAITHGTTTIRSLHQEIANIPFEILESLPTTREPGKMVRGVHDITADGVYASIITINKLMGQRLRQQFKLKAEDDPSNPGDE